MDKEKAKALSKTLACYKELQENNSVNLIEFLQNGKGFHYRYGRA